MGWEIESRPRAEVVHRGRRSLRGLLAQVARHGSGAAWLNRVHPGSLPRRKWQDVTRATLRQARSGARGLKRRDRDAALVPLVGMLVEWAFEVGRLLPNDSERRSPRHWTRGMRRFSQRES
jgi:hypothetical protein